MSRRAGLALCCVAVIVAVAKTPARADDAVSVPRGPAGAVDASWACPAAVEAAGALDSTILEAGAYALAAWITESRRSALREGVQPLPPGIRGALQGFVPEDILEVVRWRVGGASQLALQTHLSKLGLLAVTLADVVVFSDEETALTNPGLWAHELRHVMQYRECGVAEFARSYVRNHERLEEDARAYARRWHRWSLERGDGSEAPAVN